MANEEVYNLAKGFMQTSFGELVRRNLGVLTRHVAKFEASVSCVAVEDADAFRMGFCSLLGQMPFLDAFAVDGDAGIHHPAFDYSIWSVAGSDFWPLNLFRGSVLWSRHRLQSIAEGRVFARLFVSVA